MDQLLHTIAQTAEEEQTLLAIVFVVLCVVVIVPLYTAKLYHERKKRKALMDHEHMIIQVVINNSQAISKNSEVISSLKQSIDTDNALRGTSFDRVHKRIDALTNITADISKLLYDYLGVDARVGKTNDDL